MELAGKAAVVTGGGTGVGRATALELARRGCSVLINYSKSKEDAEQTAAAVAGLGVKGLAIKADVIDDADCRKMIDAAVSEFGRLDVLINNAGTTSFIKHDDLEAVKMEDWDRIFKVNLIGPFQCARAARAALTASGNGEIVNISSVAGVAGTGSSIPYCASKAALNNMTVTLARVFAPTVRVNSLAPGFITTRWLPNALGEEAYLAAKKSTEEKALLKKVLSAEDVAVSVLSIITGSDLLTGQVITLDAGVLIANHSVR